MRQTNLLKRAMSVVLGLVLGASALLAQNITVTGTVTDAMKEPIIGASILQQGTTNGTATDIDGNFTLSVPADALLEISSIGFETRVLKATAKMEVILVEDSEMLNETVVVGYGVQKRESLTGAITQIRSEDIAATKTADGVAALQGKIPGLLITQNSGKPGAFASETKSTSVASVPRWWSWTVSSVPPPVPVSPPPGTRTPTRLKATPTSPSCRN